jgi:hypothetical protein
MKKLLLLLVAGSVALAPTVPAFARGDGWQPIEAEDFTVTACGTDVQVHIVVNKEYFRVVTLDGRDVVQITGNLVVELTNLATGESITVDASGPGQLPLERSALVATGLNLFIFFPGQQGSFDLPDIILTRGNLDMEFDENGILTSFSLQGTLVDLCAAITG